MLATKTLIDRRYEIVRLIGSGGMGAVYEAMDTRLGRRVALKQLTVSGEKLEQAFAHEARLLAALKHLNLPDVYDHFTDPQGQFLVMEYIPGDDLQEALKERGTPFPVDEVLRWADQLLVVLDYLHTQADPIIHRDIKPANIKVVNGTVKLLDFGLTKGTPDFLTRHHLSSVMGYTIKYAPPEQPCTRQQAPQRRTKDRRHCAEGRPRPDGCAALCGWEDRAFQYPFFVLWLN